MKESIRPFAYWGSKGQMAQWVSDRLIPHEHFVDVCAGSAVITMVKPPSLLETINDLNRDITNFFRVLQSPRKREILVDKVSFTPYSQIEFQDCLDHNGRSVDRAFSFFVRMQMASVPGKSGWAYCINGKSGKKANKPGRWASMPGHLLKVAERFKSVQIIEWDVFEVLRRLDKPGVLFFIDPPYIDSSRPKSVGSSSAYKFDSFDFNHFSRACSEVVYGDVMVTHYPHPYFDDDPRWICIGDFDSHRDSPNGKVRSKTIERFYLWDRI